MSLSPIVAHSSQHAHRGTSFEDQKQGIAAAGGSTDAGTIRVPSSTSDFVKRLYRMLEEETYPDALAWSNSGDVFVIKDLAEFTKSVLPKEFRHSNFSSFVRQLNKYSFRKVKNPGYVDIHDDNDQTWAFKHDHFQSKNVRDLELVKRKVAPVGKQTPEYDGSEDGLAMTSEVTTRLDSLAEVQEQTYSLAVQMNSSYQILTREVTQLRRAVTEQNALLQTIAANQMLAIRPQAVAGPVSPPLTRSAAPLTATSASGRSPSQNTAPMSAPPTAGPVPFGGAFPPQLGSDSALPPFAGSYSTGRQRAAWAVTPGVLLIGTDTDWLAQILQAAGCRTNQAQDAVEGIQRCAYDLVFIDLGMPGTDASPAATSIRQFDLQTPVVGITTHAGASYAQQYFMAGVTEILARPFTADDLHGVLEKYLSHMLHPQAPARADSSSRDEASTKRVRYESYTRQ